MLSRVANSLYWLSRYLERAENFARLVEVNRYDSLDKTTLDPSVTEEDNWKPLLHATCLESSYSSEIEKSGNPDVGWFITFSDENNASIRQCIFQARENARMVRDQISEEFWRELNRFHLFITSKHSETLWRNQPESLYRKVIEFCMLLTGLVNTTIPHDEGWHFLQTGKMLERADKTTRVLDMLAAQVENNHIRLASALRCCSAFSAFKADTRSHSITLDNTMSFLLFSPSFPRSVRFCIRQLDHHLHTISATPAGSFSNEAERLTGNLLARLNFSNLHSVTETGYHAYIDSLQEQFNDIGQKVFETYILLPLEIKCLSQNDFIHWQHQQQQQ